MNTEKPLIRSHLFLLGVIPFKTRLLCIYLCYTWKGNVSNTKRKIEWLFIATNLIHCMYLLLIILYALFILNSNYLYRIPCITEEQNDWLLIKQNPKMFSYFLHCIFCVCSPNTIQYQYNRYLFTYYNIIYYIAYICQRIKNITYYTYLFFYYLL